MQQKLLRSLFFIFSTCFSVIINAQPVNDFQCAPHFFGLLPSAPLCTPSGPGITVGAAVTVLGTTLGATNDSLSGAITSCYTGAAPLKDVWYKFKTTDSHLIVAIQGVGATPLNNVYVALYESVGDECVGLMPRQCYSASGVALDTFDFAPLAYSITYYLQVSSTTSAGAGNFSLSLRSKNVCADCMKISALQSYPLPVCAAFPPDTTVGFCYSVVGYNERYGNRLHGIVPLLGSGWDATTFNALVVPASADGVGQWHWFSNINVNGSIESGYFYDIGADGDPTNNLGDGGGIVHVWTFCFSVKTHNQTACASGLNDLSIDFVNYSDGESGSLVTPQDCSGDPDYKLDAHMNCCQKPIGLATAASCTGTMDGAINAYGGSFSAAGYTYDLYNNSGTLIDNFFSVSSAFADTSLNPGNYYLYVTDHANNCQSAINIQVNGPLVYNIEQTTFGCGGTGCTNTAHVNITSGATSSILWNSGTSGSGPVCTNLCTGWNYVTMIDTGIVSCTITDSIFITNLPIGNPNFSYNQNVFCTSDSFAIVGSYPTTAGGAFTIIGPSLSAPIDSLTGTISLVGITTAGVIYVRYHTGAPCIANAVDTIYVDISPPPVPIFTDHIICYGDPNPNFLNTLSNSIVWHDSTTVPVTQTSGNSYDPFGGSTPLPGIYNFNITQQTTVSGCESVPKPISITVYNPPAVDAGLNISICPGFGVNLHALGANNYTWFPSTFLDNATVPDPLASPTLTTVFNVVGTDATTGCSSSDSVTVFVDSTGGCDLVIYHGFTPNGDGHNDYWHIDGISIDKKNTVTIFSRWGEKIWETVNYDNINNRWVGQSNNGLVPDGTYYYVITFKEKHFKGWVELTH